VPNCAPVPFTKSSHGIVPACGYAIVLGSTTSIATGTLLWGYFPISTVPKYLQLAPAAVAGHWLESGEHRKHLRPLYQRYIACDPSVSLISMPQKGLDALAWTAIFRPVWECDYLLNRFVYSPDEGALIHYSGTNQPWTPADAVLTSTVVVSRAGSSKTALSFFASLLIPLATSSIMLHFPARQ
jgi:hypothetical protein